MAAGNKRSTPVLYWLTLAAIFAALTFGAAAQASESQSGCESHENASYLTWAMCIFA